MLLCCCAEDIKPSYDLSSSSLWDMGEFEVRGNVAHTHDREDIALCDSAQLD